VGRTVEGTTIPAPTDYKAATTSRSCALVDRLLVKKPGGPDRETDLAGPIEAGAGAGYQMADGAKGISRDVRDGAARRQTNASETEEEAKIPLSERFRA